MKTKIDPWTGEPVSSDSQRSKYEGWTDAEIRRELDEIAADALEVERARDAVDEALEEELKREREAANS